MCLSGVTYLPADYCFSELALFKIPTQRLGLVQSGYRQNHHLIKM